MPRLLLSFEENRVETTLGCVQRKSRVALRIGELAMAVLLAAVLGLASCQKSDAAAKGGNPADRPSPVSVAKVVVKPVPIEITAYGNVEANATVSIKAEVQGILTKVYIVKGQEVKAGDKLFEIDPRPYQAAVDQARAAVEQAKAMKTKNQAAAHRAQADLKRVKDLRDKKIASDDDYDNSVMTAAATAAAVLADDAAVIGGEAAVRAAEINLERCCIRSQLEGVVGNILADEGNHIKSGDAALAIIRQVRPVDVFFAIPQKDLPLVRKYQKADSRLPVEASLPDVDAPPEVGTLTFIDNAIDKTTGTILLGAQFPNLAGRLWPGLYVNVVMRLAMQDSAVVVPTRAVQAGRDGKYVFVAAQLAAGKDGKTEGVAEIRPVTVARTAGEESVIESGLKPGETVVTEGQFRIKQGAKLSLKEDRAASQPAGGPARAPATAASTQAEDRN